MQIDQDAHTPLVGPIDRLQDVLPLPLVLVHERPEFGIFTVTVLFAYGPVPDL